MSSENNENLPPPSPQRRRSSIAEMFATRPTFDSSPAASSVPKSGAMASAMAQQQQRGTRRLSITTLGLSGSPTRGPNTGNPFDALKNAGPQTGPLPRQERLQSDESAVEEDSDEVAPLNGDGSRPESPSLGRRMSSGSRPYRDGIRSGSMGSGASESAVQDETSGANGSPGSSKASSPPSSRKDGFNWSETLRVRAQRSSISSGSAGPAAFQSLTPPGHGRSTSIVEPVAPPPQPPKVLPRKAPDQFQERILKGDFYMD